MHTMLHRATTLCLSLCSLLGCDAEDPCDPGQRFEHGACIVALPMQDHDASIDAARPSPPMDAAAACAQALEDALGMACAASSECGCAADYCAVMPGQTVGYCTLAGCEAEADDCPSGYTCFDLSSLGVMGVEPFCSRQ
jgi:hypothetical protein